MIPSGPWASPSPSPVPAAMPGGELLRLLSAHPELELGAGRRRQQRGPAGDRDPAASGRPGRPTFVATDPAPLARPTSSSSPCRTASPRPLAAELPAPTSASSTCGADFRLADAGGLATLLRRRRTPAPGRTACPSCPAQRAALARAPPDRRARLLRRRRHPGPGAAARRRPGRARRRRGRRRRPAPPAPGAARQAAPARQRGHGRDVAPTRSAAHQHMPEIEQA